MSTGKHLNDLFEAARHAQPIVSEEEIALQLQVKGSHTPKQSKLLNLKTVFIMSTLFIIFISAFYFWMPANETKVFTPQGLKSNRQFITAHVKAATKHVIALATMQAPTTQPQVSLKPVSEIAKQRDQVMFPSSQQPLYPQVSSSDEQLHYLELDHEALRGLHIYTDGNTLMYINTKDSSLFRRKKLSDVDNYFYLRITFEGGALRYSSNNEKAPDASQLLDLRPALVEREITFVSEGKDTKQNVGDIESNIASVDGMLCLKQDYIDLVKSNFVPIKVKLTGKKSIFGKTDQDIIFWFEPTRAFLAALPAAQPLWVSEAVKNYNESIYKNQLKKLQVLKANANDALVSQARRNHDFMSALPTLSPGELMKLGFKVDDKTMRYENRCAPGKYLGIYVTNGYGHSTYYHRRGSLLRNMHYAKLPFYPLFCTSSSGYVQIVPDDYDVPADLEKYDERDRALMLFGRMKDKLIPVKINLPHAAGMPIEEVYWFEPTPEFLAAYPKEKAVSKPVANTPDKTSRDINLSNLKVLELTPGELKMLGISVSDKSVHMYSGGKAVNSGKGKPFYMSYSKVGTHISFSISKEGEAPQIQMKMASDSMATMDFSGYDEAPDTNLELPSYSLITDDLGLLWRSYKLDDQLSGEELAYVRKNKIDPGTWKVAIDRREASESKLIANIGTYIPVLIRSGDVNLPDDDVNKRWRADIIVWYEPSELLFNALPPRIANDLRAEYQSIFVKKEGAPSCKYFEACQNSPGAISTYNVYPNPTEDDLQIDFSIDNLRTMNANIYTINGQLAKNIFSNQTFDKGSHAHKTHLNDLAPGMYLLIIESDKGDKVSQRIIRK